MFVSSIRGAGAACASLGRGDAAQADGLAAYAQQPRKEHDGRIARRVSLRHRAELPRCCANAGNGVCACGTLRSAPLLLRCYLQRSYALEISSRNADLQRLQRQEADSATANKCKRARCPNAPVLTCSTLAYQINTWAALAVLRRSSQRLHHCPSPRQCVWSRCGTQIAKHQGPASLRIAANRP